MPEETAIEKKEVVVNGQGLVLRTIDDMMRFARCVEQGNMLPRYLTPQGLVVIMQMGYELGLGYTQSLKGIYPVNNKPSLEGKTALALVKQSGLLEWIKKEYSGEGQTRKCIVTSQRKGDPEPVATEFSTKDAIQAGLASKDIYKKYPDRMLYYRALGFNLDESFPDVTMGLQLKETAQEDYDAEIQDAHQPQTDAEVAKREDRTGEVEADTRTVEGEFSGLAELFQSCCDTQCPDLVKEKRDRLFLQVASFICDGGPKDYDNIEKWDLTKVDNVYSELKFNGIPHECLEMFIPKDEDATDAIDDTEKELFDEEAK